MEIGGFKLDFNGFQNQYNSWLKQQPAAVEVVLAGVTSALQGVCIGYVLGNLTPPSDVAADASNPALTAQLKALQSGGPWAQARNLGVLTGVNGLLSAAIKKARNGKDDVYTAMGASFGSGFCYSLVSGAPNPLQAAVTTGAAFALFNGLFYQIGQNFKPDPKTADTEYERAKYMLATLGLTKYADNLKRQLLTDNTIMLWNDRALQEARIPAGPRLVILHHLDAYRSNPNSVLKSAVPLPYMPSMSAAPLPAPQYAAAGAGAGAPTQQKR